MKLEVSNGIKFNLIIKNETLSKNKITVVFLHGFLGCADDWKHFHDQIDEKFQTIAIDSLGHGETDSPVDPNFYRADMQAKFLDELFTQLNLKKFILCGYSMGGRLALSFMNDFPQKVCGLFLESTSPGIKSPIDKAERLLSDDRLIEFINKSGIDSFVDFWFDLPLFYSLKNLPSQIREALKMRRRKNSSLGIINSLRGFGTGMMPQQYNLFDSIKIPVQLVSGSLDIKYTTISKSIAEKYSLISHAIINGTGHNTHLEKSGEFVSILNKFLTSHEWR